MKAAIVLSILTGCATKHPGTYEVAGASGAANDTSALRAQADAAWAERANKAKLEEALAAYEKVYAVTPTDRDVATKLVRGWYFKGDAYETEMEAKLAAWEQAITWGKRCMAINPEFTALLEKGDETEATAVRVATKEDVPCIYWTSSALGKWAKASGLAKTLKHIGTVKAYMTRVGELDPSFFYYGPDRYWGAYYAAIPSFAGRDLDLAKEHFEKSLAGAPEYVGTKVLLAEYWAVSMQDQAAFDKLLAEVAAADPASVPDIAPEIQAEQQKAKDLASKKSDLFAE